MQSVRAGRFRALASGLVALVFIVAACSPPVPSASTSAPASPAAGAKPSGTITAAFDLGPGGCAECFNPLAATGGFTFLEKIYSKLVLYDAKFEKVVGDLAEKWSVSTDNLTYTFTLRDNAKWHDGQPVRAEDVLFTINLSLNKNVSAWFAGQLAGTGVVGGSAVLKGDADAVTGVSTPDSRTIAFKLEKPNASFLDVMTAVPMLPKHALSSIPPSDVSKTDWWRRPIGSGPFRFVRNEPGQFTELEAFEGYFRGAPRVAKLVNRYYKDTAAAALALEKGEIDFAGQLPVNEIQRLRSKQGITVLQGPSLVGNVLAFNLRGDGAFKDKRARQAVMYAIDRKQIVDSLYGGSAEVTNCWPWLPKYVPDGLATYNYDPAKARSLLSQAGWDASRVGELELITYYADQVSQSVLVAIQQQLGQLGIKVSLRTLDVPTWGKAYYTDAKFSVTFLGTAYGPDPDRIRPIFDSQMVPPAGTNAAAYSNARLDELLRQGAVLTDESQRTSLYRDVCKLLNEEVPFVFLWTGVRFGALSKPIANFVWTPTGAGRYYDQAHLWAAP